MFLKIMLTVALLHFGGAAFAQKPDLTGGHVIRNGFCNLGDGSFACSLFEKEGMRYILLLHDGKTIIIYKIPDGASGPYKIQDLILLWSIEEEVAFEA